jgi:cation diffusion facilitator family transporter
MTAPALQRNTLTGLVASLGLALVKLVAGWAGQSTALMADAMESLADTVGSLFVWKALVVASRQPDDTHPYGYGKAEAMAAFLVGGLLVVAALGIVVRAFHEVVVPHDPPAKWTLLVLIAVIGVKEVLFRIVHRGALANASDAARADAWHHRSDAITSLAAFAGVTIAIWGTQWTGIRGLVIADEIAAILASGIILMTARSLMQPAVHELLDAASPELAADVHRIAGAVAGVRLVEKVLLRKSGSGFLLDMHLQVDPGMSIREAHALAGKVKFELRAQLPRLLGALIHVEPWEETA